MRGVGGGGTTLLVWWFHFGDFCFVSLVPAVLIIGFCRTGSFISVVPSGGFVSAFLILVHALFIFSRKGKLLTIVKCVGSWGLNLTSFVIHSVDWLG